MPEIIRDSDGVIDAAATLDHMGLITYPRWRDAVISLLTAVAREAWSDGYFSGHADACRSVLRLNDRHDYTNPYK